MPHTRSSALGRGLLPRIALLLLGAAALGVALSRARFSSSPHVEPLRLVAQVLVPVAAAWLGGWRRGAAAARVALALTVAAIAVSGAVELPAAIHIDALGRTPWGSWLVLLPASALLLFARIRDESEAWRPALTLLAAYCAFGGAIAVRAGDERFFLLGLLSLQTTILASRASAPAANRAPLGLLIGAGLLAIGLCDSPAAVDPHRHLQGLVRIVVALVPAAVAWRTGGGSAVVDAALRGLCLGVLAGTLVGLQSLLEASSRIGAALALGARLPLLGLHPNIAAAGLAVVVPIALYWALVRRGGDRWLGLSTALLALFEFFLTRSRGATAALAAGCGLALFLLFLRRFRPRTRAVALAVFALAGVLVASWGVREIQRRRTDAASIGESLRFRLYVWETAWRAIRERPWAGYGLLTADPLMAFARPSDFDGRSKDTHPHAVPLFWALGTGLAGAALYLAGFTLLLASLARRTLRAARREVGLHAALLASGTALFLANLVDQGLALETAFPLHLGWLFALGGPWVPLPRLRRPLLLTSLALAAGLAATLPSIAADRLVRRAHERVRRLDRTRAMRDAWRAASLWPFDLETNLRAAKVLAAAQATERAIDVLERSARRHPLSARPWDELATLLWQERNLEGAWRALTRARALDPTGPLHASRSLDAARFLLAQGKHEEGLEELARAFRSDPTSVERIPWLQGAEGEKYVYFEGISKPIFLRQVLERNHRYMYEVAKRDFVEARRTAASLARGYLFLGRPDLARSAIEDFERLTGRSWLALEYMRREIEVAEGRKREKEGGPDDGSPSGPQGSAVTAPAGDAVPADVRGAAGVWMGEAKARLAADDARGAIEAVRRALDEVYDVSAEREYVALLFDILVLAQRRLGELDEARAALEGALYLRPRAEHAVERIVLLAEDFVEAGRHAEAVDLLAEAARLVPYVPSGPAGKRPLVRFANALAPYLGSEPPANDETERARIRRTVARILLALHDHPIGELLVIRRLREQGRTSEARRRLERFRREHPEWSER